MKNTKKLKRFLSEKLAEFLDSKFLYRLRRITTLEKKQLYIGPTESNEQDSTGMFLIFVGLVWIVSGIPWFWNSIIFFAINSVWPRNCCKMHFFSY